jgi:16S rRNA (cytosine1402-N4)-methyltransferase
MPEIYHEPVLLKESVDALSIVEEGIYMDATFGGGGHSKEILKRLGAKGRLIAFDRDADAAGNKISDKRFMLIGHNFRYAKKFLTYYEGIPLNGLIADLGISSHQINEAERGFSTRFDADLDMRMNQKTDLTAAVIINTYSEGELLRVFSEYGEIRNSRTLAGKIVEARKEKAISTINDFKNAIVSCAERGMENQYYAKVFQALRIEVNDELGALKELLVQCPDLIMKGGRLVMITYHSLEDRLVKNFISKGKFEGELEKDLYGNTTGVPFRAVNRKPLLPTEAEQSTNPRSRSAKLRIAERI